MIRYSIVIPTKSRSGTLRHVLRNVLSSPRNDIEVVVQQCGNDPGTDAVVAEVDDSRVHYLASDDVVPMRENWERAVARAKGDFVTVIGDDDGIIPGAFEIADDLIGRHGPSLLSWRPVTYYWPGFFDEGLAGRAIYHYEIATGNIRFSTKYALRCLYRFKWHYSEMPMIYNSFVSRGLIDSVRSRQGRYFLLNSPDITSGVVNALHCGDFVWSNYPLTITGISGMSTGHRIAMQGSPKARDEAVAEWMPERLGQDWAAFASNLDFSIAAELLTLRERVDVKDPGLTVAMPDVAEYVARQLHKYPKIEESREVLRSFCVRRGVDFDELGARYLLERLPTHDLPAESSTPGEIVMNCNLAERGDTDICAAARSIAAYLGPPKPVPMAAVGFDSAFPPLSSDPLKLQFSRTGNAPQHLRDGWNASEGFGTWSSRHEATIELPALEFPAADGRLRVEVAGRGPILNDEMRFCFRVSIAGTRCSRSGEFSSLRISGAELLEVDVADLRIGAPLKLIVRCLELVNPAMFGGRQDDRPLGFGLETVTLTFVSLKEALDAETERVKALTHGIEELEGRDAEIRSLNEALGAETERARALTHGIENLERKRAEIRSLKEALRAETERARALTLGIEEKERVLQELHEALKSYRSAFSVFGVFIGPMKVLLAPYRYIRNLAGALFTPKLGTLSQHAPRDLHLPAHYSKPRVLAAYRRISIVTPSFGQAAFIERTIRSVLGQEYPALGFFVQDGGSDDGTVEILRKYEDRLVGWDSSSDSGQTEAINRGFARVDGEIMAWLNSDDVLLPGALAFVADYFDHHPEIDVVYGHRILIDENDREIGRWILPPHDDRILSWADFVPQETLFWRRSIWDKAGSRVDESFRFAMDWDLLVRFREAGARFARVPRFLGGFRVHPQQKTSAVISDIGFKEMGRIRERVLGRVPSRAEIGKAVFPYMMRHLASDFAWRVRRRLGNEH